MSSQVGNRWRNMKHHQSVCSPNWMRASGEGRFLARCPYSLERHTKRRARVCRRGFKWTRWTIKRKLRRLSYGLIVLNTMFIKQRRHLVTYSSGGNETQIDYHLVPSFVRRRVKDCKVILGESLEPQHRLLLSEFFSGKAAPRRQTGPEKIKWHKLNSESGDKFIAVMQEYLQDILNLDGDAYDGDLEIQEMWSCLQDACLERARTYMGSSINRNHIVKETW